MFSWEEIMKKLSLLAISILIILLASSFAWAGAGNNAFRFGVQFVSPTGDLTDVDETLEADNAVGVSLGFEHVFIDRIGLDFNLGYSKHDLELSSPSLSGTVGDVDMLMPITAGVNFHIIRNNIVDFYAGPFVGYVLYGDIDPTESQLAAISIENDFAFGGVLGLDVSLTGKGLMFTSALKYIQTSAEPEVPSFSELDVDPWVVQLGLGYRF
jgi:outer membrane protein W